jgi:hypothetical protein
MLEGTIEYRPELFGNLRSERASWSRDKALQKLDENTRNLIGVIQSMSEEKLSEPVTLPIGGGQTLPWRAWIMM